MRPCAAVAAAAALLVLCAAGWPSAAGACTYPLAPGRPIPVRVPAGFPTSPANQAAAQSAVAQTLAAAPLPPGATAVTGPPCGWALTPGAGSSIGTNLASATAYYRVPGSASSLYSAVRSSPPAGSHLGATGTSSSGGTTVDYSVSFTSPDIPGQVGSRSLNYTFADLGGGETALSVFSQAEWLIPRPASEVVPAGVKSMLIGLGGPVGDGAPPISVHRTTDAAAIRNTIAAVDALQLMQPGLVHSCPVIPVANAFLHVEFFGSHHSPLASATESGCGSVSFWIGGQPQFALQNTPDLASSLWQAGVLPPCPGPRLTATPGTSYPGNAAGTVSLPIDVESSGAGTCSVGGQAQATVSVRGARPVRAAVAAVPLVGATTAAVLGTGESAEITLSWRPAGHGCHAVAATAATISLPRVRGHLTVALGTAKRPIRMCAGSISVGEVQEGYLLPPGS
jgi:hypothetical protein